MKCGDCPNFYVGETGREFKTRLREHKDNVRLGRESSALFTHVRDSNHAIDWGGAGLVYKSRDTNKRLVVESALIKTLPNFNNLGGVSSIDKASSSIILDCNKEILKGVPITQ